MDTDNELNDLFEYQDIYDNLPELEDVEDARIKHYDFYKDTIGNLEYLINVDKPDKSYYYAAHIKQMIDNIKELNELFIDSDKIYNIASPIRKITLYILLKSTKYNYFEKNFLDFQHEITNGKIKFLNMNKCYYNIQNYLQYIYWFHIEVYINYLYQIQYLFDHNDVDSEFKKSMKKYCTYRKLSDWNDDTLERYQYLFETCKNNITIKIGINMNVEIPKIFIFL